MKFLRIAAICLPLTASLGCDVIEKAGAHQSWSDVSDTCDTGDTQRAKELLDEARSSNERFSKAFNEVTYDVEDKSQVDPCSLRLKMYMPLVIDGQKMERNEETGDRGPEPSNELRPPELKFKTVSNGEKNYSITIPEGAEFSDNGASHTYTLNPYNITIMFVGGATPAQARMVVPGGKSTIEREKTVEGGTLFLTKPRLGMTQVWMVRRNITARCQGPESAAAQLEKLCSSFSTKTA